MGIYRNRFKRLALRILSLVLLLSIAPLIPWWTVLLIGTVLIVSKIASVELIAIGTFFDFFLLDAESGFFGLFYSLSFFVIVIAFAIVNSIHSNHGA